MNNISLFDFIKDGEKYKPKKSDEWSWSFKDYPSKKNNLKVFSCFACGGGSTMGYKLAGCEVLGCCEIDPKINEIYKKNHHPKYNFMMDIRDFNKLDNIPKELYNLDILDGSPPCTTFSMVGEREESWGKKKKFREGQKEQTLDDLSFVFIDTVEKLKPKIVIMENVEGLILGEAFKYVKEIYNKFNKIGYSVNHWLLKSENMGVPQTRHRVFFIAAKKELDIDLKNIDMCFNYAEIPYKEIKSGEGGKLNKNTNYYKILNLAIKEDKRISDTYKRLGEKERCYGSKIIWDENIMQTVTAKYECFRGETKERVSIDDIISAQTFPKDYNFGERTFNNVAYICGMSVPPVMIKRIVERLIENNIFKYKESEGNNDR